MGAQQVFGREVGGRAHVRARIGVGRVHPVLQQPIAHGQGQGPVIVVPGGQARRFGLAVEEMAPHRGGKGPSWTGHSGVFRHGAGWVGSFVLLVRTPRRRNGYQKAACARQGTQGLGRWLPQGLGVAGRSRPWTSPGADPGTLAWSGGNPWFGDSDRGEVAAFGHLLTQQ